MAELIPVILAKNFADFKKKLATIKKLRPKPRWIQIDVVDGKFAPWKTYNNPGRIMKAFTPTPLPKGEGGRRQGKGFNVEVDLMAVNPLRHAKAWIKAGAKRILFHVEQSGIKHGTWNMEQIVKIAKYIKSHGAKVGLSLNARTPLSLLTPYIKEADGVLLLGVNPGRSGQPFQKAVLNKIRTLHRKFPALPIEVDGGVSLKNAALILRAGATRLAASSAIHGSKNPQQAYKKLLKVINKFDRVRRT